MFIKKILILGLVLILSISLLACNRDNEAQEDISMDENPIEEEKELVEEKDSIQEMISNMSLEEKIGQLLIVGIDNEVFSDRELYQLNTNKVGGFIFFSRNIRDEDQFLTIVNQLKVENPSEIPLFLAIDEEGGMVSRLSSFYGNLPDVKSLGDLNKEEVSYEYGVNLGKRLSQLGLNLNFAPVLDINSNPDNPVIGSRSFGNTAEIVEKHGMEVFQGIESQGIISTVKHFPGHGDTSVDSHYNLPIVNKDKEELMELELRPFIKAIEEEIEMMMIAHILYSALDSETPSTMSETIMQDLLRTELGYENIIISDDMTMGAITENYTIEVASVEFLKNGGDILLICHGEDNPSLVIEAIKDSIENDEITIDEIEEKVYRILSLKDKYSLDDDELNNVDLESIMEETNNISNRIINEG